MTQGSTRTWKWLSEGANEGVGSQALGHQGEEHTKVIIFYGVDRSVLLRALGPSRSAGLGGRWSLS